MEEATEQEFVFQSRELGLNLHTKREEQFYRGGQFNVIPAELVRFEQGKFKTNDSALADRIRKTPAFRDRRVIELTANDFEMLKLAEEYTKKANALRTKVVRGAVSGETLHKEAGVEKQTPVENKPSLQEKAKSKCADCGKEFEDDFSGAKLRGHMMHHRRKAQSQKKE
jgi:hypothetical protein